ncbi:MULTISPECIES: chlorophyll a/b-binding protein [unclassified Nostoc]|jgi:hypothetical protein|uniref:chlorophyll a/b-binding protein n=1 Tax=unclassified Nostoc TaxID=2593658 RepID=UPI002AD527A9|nr:chlorophyll a/b-binding protein [Nostoc sp. DedSLP03]MDZ7964644.1 chlorophyll a/b-binding protein [Nostoc sp. DedSLP03]
MSDLKNSASIVSEDPNAVRFGFTPQSENWNGRLAMIGFVSAILIEAFSGQGLLHFWGIL